MKRWVIGVAAAFAVLAMAGVGFSAFTATATVNGTAYAGSAELTVVQSHFLATLCEWYNFSFYTGGSITVTPVSSNVLSFSVTNLVPGVRCFIGVNVTNVGSVPLSVTGALVPGAGICSTGATNGCFDAGTWLYPIDAITGVTSWLITPSLSPGAIFYDFVVVGIPPGFTSAPTSASFSIVYTGTAGV